MQTARRRGDSVTSELRREAGRWLKQKREAAGLSQRDLAVLLNINYYTFISQMVTGRGRIPAARYVDWADALQIDPREFVYNLMRYYDPVTFEVLFENSGRPRSGRP